MSDEYYLIELPAAARVPLPADEVSQRLAVYNGNGSLQRDLAFAWEQAGEIILRASLDFWAWLPTSSTSSIWGIRAVSGGCHSGAHSGRGGRSPPFLSTPG